MLKAYNVTHILTVASSLRPAHPDDFVYKVVRGMIMLKVLPLLSALRENMFLILG